MADNQRTRKRNWLKSLISKQEERTSSPKQTVTLVLASTPAPAPAPTPGSLLGERLLGAALDDLTEEEQGLIKKYTVDGVDDINIAISQSYLAALDRKQAYNDRKWQWSFRGKRIVLRDEAEKIIKCLNIIKPAGNAGIHPIHAGLPWAGISALLDVVTSNYMQMAALLTGMSLALAVSNRLRAYLQYCERLPPDLTTTNFEEALVRMYALVFRFIASAIRIYDQNVLTRTFQAPIKTSSLEDFEITCDRLGSRAEIEASNCDRLLSGQDRERAKRTMEELDQTLNQLRNIQDMKETVEIVKINVELQRLRIARGATFDSYEDEHAAKCLEGTRTQLLQQVISWVSDPFGQRILWLCGKAGTGKSTIARTVGHLLNDSSVLGASFFFKRGGGDRANASCFFPTIVQQLIDKIPEASQGVADALEADALLCDRSLQQQFERLLFRPFAAASQQQTKSRQEFVILIDALDECERNEDIGQILRLLSEPSVIGALNLRIFVTSRPEMPVQIGFKTEVERNLQKDIVLEEAQATTLAQDVRTYFDYRFKEISQISSVRGLDPLPLDWPGDDVIDNLVDLAMPLFIFASTVCRYVEEGDPMERLDMILEQGQNRSLSGLEKVYLPILQHTISDRDTQEHESIIADFTNIVGAVVLLAEPLSAASLSALLEVSKRRINFILSRLHSLLSISNDAPIKTLHLSFRDFLIDSRRTKTGTFQADEYYISESQTHTRLATQCLRHLERSGAFKQDICEINKPGITRAEVDTQDIANHISTETAYACSYWAWHMIESGQELFDGGQVHRFMQRHFLHWLEALSWLERLSSVVAYITKMRSIVKVDKGLELSALLDDALRFVLRSRYIIDLAPLQAYHSAIVFTPVESIIRKTFEEQLPKLWACLPDDQLDWNAEMMKLEGHDHGITGIAFSPDGQTIASASLDGTIRLWSTQTGEQMYKLEGHDGSVMAVAFSQDGKLASGSSDMTVRLWNTQTGEEIQAFEGHTNTVTAVAFSLDGQEVVSASADSTVWVRNAETGENVHLFERHGGEVRSVTCSTNEQVASASGDDTVRVWNAQTGVQTSVLEIYGDRVESVAFSPDGKMLALAVADSTVQIWDVQTSKQIQILEGHDGWVTSVAFSPDGQIMVSSSSGGTLRIWNVREAFEFIQEIELRGSLLSAVSFSPDGQLLALAGAEGIVRLYDVHTILEPTQKLEKHDSWVVTIAFSNDGQYVASGVNDHKVCLWDAGTGKKLKELEGHDGWVTAVAFSPDGQIIASTSNDGMLCLWDVQTGKQMRMIAADAQVLAESIAVAFLPNLKISSSVRQLVVAIPHREMLQLWDAQTGEVVQTDEEIHFTRTLDGIYRRSLSTQKDSIQVQGEDCELAVLAPSLALEEPWIQCHGEDLLWLPVDHRGIARPITSAVARGKTLVIGQGSGAVSFFRLL